MGHARAVFAACIALSLLGIGPAAGEPLALGITGFYRFEPAFSLAGPNPNNRNINNAARDWNLFRLWGELETTWDFSRNLRVYAKFRLIADNADNLDGDVRNFENFPNDFAGNGWMLRVDNDHVSAEVWELYADVQLYGLWIRLGKQEIVWGETIASRLLDVVNPLDLSWHLFLDPWTDEFDNTRRPLWFARGLYSIPNLWVPDLAVEGVVNPGDVIPTTLPVQGSPYNLVPTFVTVNDRVRRGEWIGGGRLTMTLLGASLSFVYLTKPVDDPVALSDLSKTCTVVPVLIVIRGAVCDPRFGMPVDIIPGSPTFLRFVSTGVHPRVDIFGGSANYYQQRLGAIFRFETTYTPDYPYQRTPPPMQGPTGIEERGTWRSAFVIDRPTTLLPLFDPTSILSVSFFETVIEGNSSKIQIVNSRVSKTTEAVALTLLQPFYRKRLYFDLLAIYDFDDAWWLQPGFRYIYGDHWRLEVFTNLFGGSETRPGRLGSLEFAKEVGTRVTWGF